MFNFFKKKKNDTGLDKMKEQNIITKQEWLKIKMERAEKEYEDYVKDRKPKR
jgi:hypothetical protein